MMKQLLIILILGFVSVSAFAQQDAQYTQYMFNGLVLNPAYAGSREATSITAIYRNQWVKMPGAPKTLSASVHTAVGEKNGVGLMLESDQIGAHSRFSLYGSYAYRLLLGEGKLSLGVQAGILNYSSDWSKVNNIKDADDPNFVGQDSKLLPNFGIGAYYYLERFYVGASIPHLLNGALDDLEKTSVYDRHYFLTSGAVFDISPAVKLKPSILIKSVPSAAPISADLNLSFLIQDALWVGGSYRFGDAVALLMEYQFVNGLRLGYSYDFNISNLNSYNRGSHEIMVGWDLNPQSPEKILSPRFF